MAALYFIATSVVISHIQSEIISNCGQDKTCACQDDEDCIFRCTEDEGNGCLQSELKCRENNECRINCRAKSSCKDAVIKGNGATIVKLVCNEETACETTQLFCDTSDCSVVCKTQPSYPCKDTLTNTDVAKSFLCAGQCDNSASISDSFGSNPTSAPSHAPTSNPTDNPSEFPSAAPSHSPTFNPSRSPSEISTLSPSKYPSSVPTTSPTYFPTNNPTMSPTSDPTHFPSSVPSLHPTSSPTLLPSSYPSKTPSDSPTPRQTEEFANQVVETTQTKSINPASETKGKSDVGGDSWIYFVIVSGAILCVMIGL